MSLVLGDELLFPSQFLSHVDLKGRPVTVTIEDISIEELRTQGGGKKRSVVMTLVGKQKKFVANKTNCGRIAEEHGTQANLWRGKKIVIKPDRDRFGNKMVDCIRVDVELTHRVANTTAEPAQSDAHEPGAEG